MPGGGLSKRSGDGDRRRALTTRNLGYWIFDGADGPKFRESVEDCEMPNGFNIGVLRL